MEDLWRIGDKLVSRSKIDKAIHTVLELRSRGTSQQEVAEKVGVDRTFVSRLEGLGEVRRGVRIALVGFPVLNRDEIAALAAEEGVDFVFLLTEEERGRFIADRSGLDLFNDVMDLLAKVRQYDAVILLGSNRRVQLLEAMLDKEVLAIEIGTSPITEDKWVDPERVRQLIRAAKGEMPVLSRGGEGDR